LRVPSSWQKFNVEVGLHPTQKPVALLEYLIKTYTNPGDLVLDNCMGSGSTGVACVNTKRRFVGIELDEKYFNIARERIGGLTAEMDWRKVGDPNIKAVAMAIRETMENNKSSDSGGNE
jgi:DNA modification methylase